jgi:hypothetical protein
MSSPPQRKVWIVSFAGHDFSDAKRYGELTPVTTGYVSLESLDRLFFMVFDALKDSSPDDYLLHSGLNILNVLAGAIWWNLHESLNALVWDQKEQKYHSLSVSKEQIDDYLTALARNGGQG